VLRDMYAGYVRSFMLNKMDFHISKRMASGLGGVIEDLCIQLLDAACLFPSFINESLITTSLLTQWSCCS